MTPMLKLSFSHADYLLNQPESGMGYQRVEARTFADKSRRGVAFNAELLVFDDEDRTPLRTKTFRTLTEAARSSDFEVRSLRVMARPAGQSARTTRGRRKSRPCHRSVRREDERRRSIQAIRRICERPSPSRRWQLESGHVCHDRGRRKERQDVERKRSPATPCRIPRPHPTSLQESRGRIR